MWLFAGLRMKEVVPLRLECVRWQTEDATIPGAMLTLPGDRFALEYQQIKPPRPSTSVESVVGESISAWEKARPT
jgi:hypothetical protein